MTPSARPAAVAIVHYHLQPGGVTRVIAHAAEALHRHGVKVAVLVGQAPPEDTHLDVPVELAVVDALAYDAPGQPPRTDGRTLGDQLEAAARRALGLRPDLFHVHNHCLGKNAALPAALGHLARRGHRLLLQPHDFAEDGRPDNYRHLLAHGGVEGLYPLADHVHYALLTRRDQGLLTEAGIPADRTHLLPNAVNLPADSPEGPASSLSGVEGGGDAVGSKGAPRFILYPTRAIRRKNVGEVLLWAAVSRHDDPHDRFALTLAPANPVHRPVYDGWKALAAELRLPVDFEVGSGRGGTYLRLLRSADALLTTSVAEGFGLTFLEPALVGRPLVGRDLPAVTADFKSEGVDLAPLYADLRVPVEWIGREALRGRLAEVMAGAYRAYGQECSGEDIDAALASLIDGAGTVDFGRLDEPLQERVIDHVAADRDARAALRPAALVPPDIDDVGRLATNERIVRDRYSLARYGERIAAVYARLLASEPSGVEALAPDAVLRQWLHPAHINLLRC